MKSIYVIGSMRNPEIPNISNELRANNFDVFDDWFSPGPEADDCWQKYETNRGRTYKEALQGYHAKHVFDFDRFYLNIAHAGVLVYPAGRSGHLELGHFASQGKPGFLLINETPERYDIMTQFATGGIATSTQELIKQLKNHPWPKIPVTPVMYLSDIQWLAGILEGEGSFCISGMTPRLVLQMTDEDIVNRAASILGSNVWTSGKKTKGNKYVFSCGRAGLTAVEWMRILRPYLGVRRNTQIVKTVKQWLKEKTYNKKDTAYWEKVFQLSKKGS